LKEIGPLERANHHILLQIGQCPRITTAYSSQQAANNADRGAQFVSYSQNELPLSLIQILDRTVRQGILYRNPPLTGNGRQKCNILFCETTHFIAIHPEHP
jgi:hypothetical protein